MEAGRGRGSRNRSAGCIDVRELPPCGRLHERGTKRILLIGARASGDWMPQPIRRGLTAARAPRASCELVSQVDLLQRDPPTPAGGLLKARSSNTRCCGAGATKGSSRRRGLTGDSLGQHRLRASPAKRGRCP
jgi:hypothetical protein